jgi:acyl transferase domain-containing protein
MIDKAELSQPLCTAVQVALINLLRKWGLSPAAVVGHSSGEIAAAYAAGAFTSDVAIRLAYLRGFVTKYVKRHGAMAAIGLGRCAVESFLTPGVVIACENSGSSVTISGDKDVVQRAMANINIHRPEVLVRKLKLDVAYHSRKFHPTATGLAIYVLG